MVVKSQGIKVIGRKIKKGEWVYLSEPMGKITIKKDEDFFLSDNEDFEGLDDIKIKDKIYDILSYGNGKVTLSEKIEFDYTGEAYCEAHLPIIIKNKAEIWGITAKQRKFLNKVEKNRVPFSKLAKESKIRYSKQLEEEGVNIKDTQVFILTVDEMDEQINSVENMYILQLLDAIIYIDMEFIMPDGRDLWATMGVTTGNYVELAKFLSSRDIGILDGDDRLNELVYTIKAIKEGKDITMYMVEQKTTALALEARKALFDLRKSFDSEEDFKRFMGETDIASLISTEK